jgi:CBS domain containing-hemolysin-like protein
VSSLAVGVDAVASLAVGVDAVGEGWSSAVALLLGVLLLLANGFFVATEIGLLAARRTLVEEAADDGDRRARRALEAMRELSVTFSGAQLGITMCSLGLGAIAQPAAERLVAGLLADTGLPPTAVPVIAFTTALSIVVFAHMVIGEMVPKNFALSRAERVALGVARPFGWFVTLFRPLIVALNVGASGLLRLVRVDPVDEHKLVHTPDELALAVTESRQRGTISPQDASVMGAALRLAAIDADAAMTPRVDLVALPDTASTEELLALAAASGHTRLPVYHQDVDHIVGMAHVKDVLIADGDAGRAHSVAELLRPIPAVPEDRDLEQLLRDMLDDRSHAVLVVDEFGGTAGLLTLEDVLEELVGDIEDEFDVEQQIRRAGERSWVVPGVVRRDEVERLVGLHLPSDEAETVSGWLVEQLGRLLEVGDGVTTPDGWELTVRTLDGRRAGEVELRAPDARRGRPTRRSR